MISGLRSATGNSGGSATVSIRVRSLAQLFSSFDPSPFWDRDLDRDAAAFIEGEFLDKQAASIWHLHVHAQHDDGLTSELQQAIENYYARFANAARRELREHFRDARFAGLAGLLLFVLCIGARSVLQGVLALVPVPVDEGLIVLAWIALWRPVELLAYEWIPLARRRRMYDRLAGIRAVVRCEAPSTAPLAGDKLAPVATYSSGKSTA